MTAKSTFRWATVRSLRIVWNSSIHSMLPMYPCSPAPQLANKIVRRGLQPFFNIDPKTRTISIIHAVAEFGSTDPYIQASRWFPKITYLRKQYYVVLQSMVLRTRSLVGYLFSSIITCILPVWFFISVDVSHYIVSWNNFVFIMNFQFYFPTWL